MADLSLIIAQDGYRDRRTLPAATVDRPKTIWILATNALDTTIQTFCAKHKTTLFGNNGAVRKLGRDLSRMIHKECIGVFGVSIFCLPSSRLFPHFI
jgi:hypothetical protein